MRPDWTFTMRLDEFTYFLTWPLVYLLALTPITPNQVALVSTLFGCAFLVAVFQGFLLTHPILLAVLLIIRLLLDCADGQLARYTQRTSNLGALYDLIGDFAFAIALFFVIAYHLILFKSLDADIVIPITVFALSSFLISATVHSFVAYLDRHSDLYPVVARQRFAAILENDRPDDSRYSSRLKLFNAIFRVTWRPISYLAFLFVLNPEKSDLHRSALRILAPLEYGMHLTALALILLLQVDLSYFLIYEITAFCFIFLLLFYHYR